MLPNLIGNKPDWEALKFELHNHNRSDIILIEEIFYIELLRIINEFKVNFFPSFDQLN